MCSFSSFVSRIYSVWNDYISLMPPLLAVVALGSNLENRSESLRQAREKLRSRFPVAFRASPVYETEPIGVEGQEPYYNQVVCFECDQEALELLSILKESERQLGRTPSKERWDSRVIDLDLIALGELVLDGGDRLQLPHAEMGSRPFVLQPLADILPEWSHPSERWGVRDRLQQFDLSTPGHVLRCVEKGE